MKLINIIILVWFSSFSGTCQSKIDICNKKSVLSNLPVVQKNIKEIIQNSNDNCVLEFLDTLTNGFIKNNNQEYIKTLDVICQIADGYVGEYFWELTEKLTFQSFDSFIEYLSLQKSNNCFEKTLLEIMSWKLQDGTSPRKDKLIKLIDNKLKSITIKTQTKKYLEELRKKLIE